VESTSLREYFALGLLFAIGLNILINFIVLAKNALKRFKKWRRNRMKARKDIYQKRMEVKEEEKEKPI
jgi:hypothetical protein